MKILLHKIYFANEIDANYGIIPGARIMISISIKGL